MGDEEKEPSEELSFLVVSDNALGSSFGDVDDAFALTALLKGDVPLSAVASCFGNTVERSAYRNTRALLDTCAANTTLLRGARTSWTRHTEASDWLSRLREPVRVLCLGPMTDVALALRRNPGISALIREIIFVATNRQFPLPAWRVFDFNQWKDPKALRRVISSGIPLTCVPLDVARRLRVTHEEVGRLPGKLGGYLFAHSHRWFRRSKRLKGVTSVPLWDLVAAMYVLKPTLFTTIETTVELTRMGQALFDGIGNRGVRLITEFDAKMVWSAFKDICAEARANGRAIPASPTEQGVNR